MKTYECDKCGHLLMDDDEIFYDTKGEVISYICGFCGFKYNLIKDNNSVLYELKEEFKNGIKDSDITKLMSDSDMDICSNINSIVLDLILRVWAKENEKEVAI